MDATRKATELAIRGSVPANVGGWTRHHLRGTETCEGTVGEIRTTYLGLSVCVVAGSTGEELRRAKLPNTHPDYRPGRASVWATIPSEPWEPQWIGPAGTEG